MLPAAIDLAALLDPRRVLFLAAGQTRDTVIPTLADCVACDWPDVQRLAFHHALVDREAVTTTAIGNGIAVPHARMLDIPCCRMALGIAPSGIAWPAKDALPVQLVILIAAREQGRTEHLHILATVAFRLSDPVRRANLIAATSPDEALRIFTA